ncbi:MAG: hypothetical protein ACFE75_07560 [Candidatus Hodarchaeota archaeon]
MKINNNSEEFELKYYVKVLDYFQDEGISREKKEIWKNQSIIELMNLLKRTQNRTFVTNALLLILSLFEDNPPDIYNNRGVNINHISENEKKYLIEELKEEFLPN